MILNDCSPTQENADALFKLYPQGEVHTVADFANALGVHPRLVTKFLRDAAKRKLIALAGKVWRRL